MLRRVKKDVVSELTGKTEITVHCKLSSRQHAFYQAIKNKISLADLIDNNRGHLNEKKIMNLMNIVIQLRKVIFYLLSISLAFLLLSTVNINLFLFKPSYLLMFYLIVGLQPSRVIWEKRRKFVSLFCSDTKCPSSTSFWRTRGHILLWKSKSYYVRGNYMSCCCV